MQPQLARFVALAIGDAALQQQLWAAAEPDAFVERVTQLGAAHGCVVAAHDVLAGLRIGRVEWRARGVLSDVIPAAGWYPMRVYRRAPEPAVEWCYLGDARFTAPFFEQTITAALRHPFNRLVRLQTPIGALGALRAADPGLAPAGFVFHMSRCGSTLIAQLLAALPLAVVIAEADPVDAVLRAELTDRPISDAERCGWLQDLVSALGRRRSAAETQLFIKFDSWSIFDLPLIRRAFPHVPWVFVYRDPVEVLVSHARMRGSQMVPGMLAPERLGLSAAAATAMPLDEYAARLLGAECAAAARFGVDEGGRFVDYRRLPDAVWQALLPFFGCAATPADHTHMRRAAQFHAKSPTEPFADDTVAKQQAATADLRHLAERWVRPAYEQLRALPQLA